MLVKDGQRPSNASSCRRPNGHQRSVFLCLIHAPSTHSVLNDIQHPLSQGLKLASLLSSNVNKAVRPLVRPCLHYVNGRQKSVSIGATDARRAHLDRRIAHLRALVSTQIKRTVFVHFLFQYRGALSTNILVGFGAFGRVLDPGWVVESVLAAKSWYRGKLMGYGVVKGCCEVATDPRCPPTGAF